MINISGGLLSALIDEANCSPFHSVQQGVLFGNRTCKRTEVLSDTSEEKVVDEYLIGITSYLNLRSQHPFWSTSNKCEKPFVLIDRDDVIGLFIIRRDGIKSPSMRDVAVANYMGNEEKSVIFPFIILQINIASEQTSWVYEMSFSCMGLFKDSPMVLRPLELKILSLSADSSADYEAAQCLNSDSIISTSMGATASVLLSLSAASSIQQAIETELLAAQLVDDIQEVASTVASLESELVQLRQKLIVKKTSKIHILV